MAKYDRFHREIPDKTPVEMPVGYEKPESLESMIARMIRVQSVQAGKQGMDTLEEADDFDCNDDQEMKSEYQFTDMEEEEFDNPKPKPKPGTNPAGTPTPQNTPAQPAQAVVNPNAGQAPQPVGAVAQPVTNAQ